MPGESTRKVYLHLYHGRYSIIFIYLRCSRSFDTRQCYYAYLIPKTKKNITPNPKPVVSIVEETMYLQIFVCI